jgi:hypothetical protein
MVLTIAALLAFFAVIRSAYSCSVSILLSGFEPGSIMGEVYHKMIS